MTNEMRVFDFKTNAVRVQTHEDGSLWFVSADICRALELSSPTHALRGLEPDEKMTLNNSQGHPGTRGGPQSFGLVSESGLYALIFKSRKPEAKAFRKWVTSEVLPEIRKTGGYQTPVVADQIKDVVRAGFGEVAVEMVKMADRLSREIEKLQDRVDAQQKEIDEFRGKAGYQVGPTEPFGDATSFLTIRDYCDRYGILDSYGMAPTGADLRAQARSVCRISRENGIPVHTAAEGPFGRINIYRIDALNLWSHQYAQRNRGWNGALCR